MQPATQRPQESGGSIAAKGHDLWPGPLPDCPTEIADNPDRY